MKHYKVIYLGLYSAYSDGVRKKAFECEKYVLTLNDARKVVREFENDMQEELAHPSACYVKEKKGIDRYIHVIELKDCTSNGKGYVRMLYNRSEIVATCLCGDTQITKNSEIFFTA